MVASALRHRYAAFALLTLGAAGWLIGTPLIDFGEDDGSVRSAAVLGILLACLRLAYLSLLDVDAKHEEGLRRGFYLGRRTAKPVVVDIRQRPRSSEARSEPNRGHTVAHDRPEQPLRSRSQR